MKSSTVEYVLPIILKNFLHVDLGSDGLLQGVKRNIYILIMWTSACMIIKVIIHFYYYHGIDATAICNAMCDINNRQSINIQIYGLA